MYEREWGQLNLATQYRSSQKLADGKSIGEVHRLTDGWTNPLQNYYDDAIRHDAIISTIPTAWAHVIYVYINVGFE